MNQSKRIDPTRERRADANLILTNEFARALRCLFFYIHKCFKSGQNVNAVISEYGVYEQGLTKCFRNSSRAWFLYDKMRIGVRQPLSSKAWTILTPTKVLPVPGFSEENQPLLSKKKKKKLFFFPISIFSGNDFDCNLLFRPGRRH